MGAVGQLRRVLMVVGLILGLVLLPAMPAMSAPGGGNSGNAKACQQGGYLALQRADGTRFRNVGECVSYAAQGGVLMPIPTATSIPTPTNVPPTLPPPTIVPPTEVPTATDVPPTAIPPTAIPPTEIPTAVPTDTPVPTDVPLGTIQVGVGPSAYPTYCAVTITFSGFTPNLSTTFTYYLGGTPIPNEPVSFDGSGGAFKDMGILLKSNGTITVDFGGATSGPVALAC